MKSMTQTFTRYLKPLWPALLLAAAVTSAFAQCEVVSVDLTKGAPKDKRFTVKGGAWEKGWRVAGDLDQIVIDAGYEIKNGYFEVVVTRKDAGPFPERKRNWMAALACAEGHQCPGGMARAGAAGYGFSKAEIFSAKQTNTICEKKFGEYADWVMDDQTEHVVRAEVRGGVMTWTNKVGDKRGQSACGDETQPVTHFRYATVGGVLNEKKGWHHGSLVGLRVLRMTVVDYDRASGCKGIPPGERGVVFDTNLRQGPGAFKGTVRGGEWNDGWRVTGNDQRLVWDAGYPVKNGYFEFWMTADTPPASPLTEFRGKIHHPDVHWAGVSGVADLAPMKKHVFALRLGQKTEGMSKGHGWSKIVVLGANNEGETEKTEQVMGDYAWWKPLSDGKKIIHFKMEWKDGVASLYLPDGSKQSCRTTGKMGNEVLISGLRYAWLGGIDEELKTAIPGMRFLRARLVDLDKTEARPTTAAGQGTRR
jgi:hypothetical protein